MSLQITLKKSPISSLQVHKATVAALGLRKVGQTVVKEDNPCIRGQIFRVKHMLEVVEIESEPKKKAVKATAKKSTGEKPVEGIAEATEKKAAKTTAEKPEKKPAKKAAKAAEAKE